jgi:hypothetical protein
MIKFSALDKYFVNYVVSTRTIDLLHWSSSRSSTFVVPLKNIGVMLASNFGCLFSSVSTCLKFPMSYANAFIKGVGLPFVRT